jgi:hypothetical protein
MAAELFRAMLGEGIFSSAAGLVSSVFAPAYAAVRPDRVYTGADGALVEDTTDAGDAGTADLALFENDDEAYYVGYRGQFSQLITALSNLASVTVAPTFQYSTSSGYATLTVTDNSVGLTKNDSIKWTPPADWAPTNLAADDAPFADTAKLYYVRIARTANTVVTPPVGTAVSLVPAPVYRSGTSHLGVAQPPLAILRVTATNTIVVEVIAAPSPRFALPNANNLVLRALTAPGANLTPTVSYVDQDGNNATQAQSAWTSPAALATVAVALAGGDTGLQSVRDTGWAVTATGLGVFALEINRLRTPAL